MKSRDDFKRKSAMALSTKFLTFEDCFPWILVELSWPPKYVIFLSLILGFRWTCRMYMLWRRLPVLDTSPEKEQEEQQF